MSRFRRRCQAKNKTIPVTAPAFVPTDIANLALWVRGDTGTVSSWTDQSGNGRHLVQGTAGNQPTINATDASFNNQRTFSFTGAADTSGDWMGTAGTFALANLTVIAVYKNSSGESYLFNQREGGGLQNAMWHNAATGASLAQYRNPTYSSLKLGTNWGVSASPRTIVGLFTGTHSTTKIRINGADQTPASEPDTGDTGSASITASLQLNAYSDGSNSGTSTYAEFLIYSRALSAAEIQQVESYLRTRYAHY